jgi:hypothetical protein
MPLAVLGPILAGAAGTSAAATTAAWGAIAAGGAVAGNLVGAHMQGGAARDAAASTAAAANHAADVQGQAQKDTLAFQERQAAHDDTVAEANRKANYDQWVASRSKLNSVADLLGMPHESIPGYVPLPPSPIGASGPGAPAGAVSGGAQPASGAGATPAINWSSPTLAADLSAFFKGRGVSDHEVPYWVAKAPELLARGQQLNDPQYATKRLLEADVFGGGAPAAGGPMTAPSAQMALGMAPPPTAYRTPAVAPALALPMYRPQSAAAYLGMA